MDKSMSEEMLRNQFLNWMAKNGEISECEVPVFCRSVDLVKYNEFEDSIEAIEFKLHDWRRAVTQALDVSISFDFVSICVPIPRTERGIQSIVSECQNRGVGLYFFDDKKMIFEEFLVGERISKIWPTQRGQVVSLMKKKKIV